MLLVLVACLAVAGVALGAQSPHEHVRASRDALSPTHPKVRSLMDQAERAYEREQAARGEPDARRHREESRAAYRDMSGSDARALGRQKFASIFEAAALDVARFGRVVRANRFSALVQADDGRKSVVDSSVPLTSDVGDGSTAPVSLALEDRGSGWAPRNPLVATSLPKDLGRGLELSRLGLGIVPADGRSGNPSVTADKAFYPEIATDTDLLVTPTPGGIETYFQVRSAQSPEEIPLHFRLAAGDRLEATNQQGLVARVVRGVSVVATISAPQTLDAGGATVPTTAAVHGDDLVVSFPHRDRDVEYPLIVDPLIDGNVVESYAWSPNFTCPQQDQPCTSDLGMPWFVNRTAFFSATNGSRGPGLYIGNLSGSYFTAHDDAFWGMWSAGSAYIYRAEYAYARLTEPSSGPRMCVGESYWENSLDDFAYGRAYVHNSSTGQDQDIGQSPYFTCTPTDVQRWIVHCYGNNPCSPVNTNGTQPTHPDGNVFWQEYAGANGIASGTGTAYLGATFLFEHDLLRPYFTTVSDPSRPTGWVDSVSPTVSATASDTGLGVKQIGLQTTNPGNPTSTSTRTHPCTGDHTYRCPAEWEPDWYPVPGQDGPADADIGPSWTQSFTYDTATMAQGTNRLGLLTVDTVGNPSTGDPGSGTYDSNTWEVKVDHTPPNVSASGGDVWLKKGNTYSASGSATDGFSGVQRVDLVVDGNHVSGSPSGADDCDANSGCPGSRAGTFSWDTANATEGRHPTNVYARDPVGHGATTGSWNVGVDGTAPTLSLTGSLADKNGKWVDDATYHLDATANDSGSGVKETHIYLDGVEQAPGDATRSCTASGCDSSMTRQYDLDTTALDQGQHTVTVNTADQVGNASVTSTITINVDRSAPSLDLSGPLFERDGQIVTNASYDLVADAEDPGMGIPQGSGVGTLDISVDDNQVLHATCDTDGCSIERTFQFDTASYGDGPHDVEVHITDRAGNTAADVVEVTVRHVDAVPPQNLQAGSSTSLRIDGGSSGDAAGSSVADVGDVSGDGIDDYLVGAPKASYQGRSQSGAAWVVLGSEDSTPLTLGGPGSSRYFQLGGAAAGDQAGTSVAALGDVNGDGIGDFAIGAPHPGDGSFDPAGPGRVYVVFGGSTLGDADLANLGASGKGFEVRAPVLAAGTTGTGKTFGSVLGAYRGGDDALAADVNGDGLDDIVIGSSSESLDTGTTYVIYGKSDTDPVDMSATGSPGSQGFRITGESGGDRSGDSAAFAGDVNGDGLADIVVAAPGRDVGDRSDAGSAYVVFGKDDNNDVLLTTVQALNQGYTIEGADGDRLASAGSLGDVNGDSLDDVLVGGRGGRVAYGKADSGTVDLAAAFAGYSINPPAGSEFDQGVVAGAGDVDGDYAPDVVLGFPNAASAAGESYVVFGDPKLTSVQLDSMTGEQGSRVDGAAAGDASGSSVDGADAAADGVPGLLIGAPAASPGGLTGAGSVYVPSGSEIAAVAAYNEPDGQASAAASTAASKRDYARNCWRPNRAFNYPFVDPKKRTIRLVACRKGKFGKSDRRSKANLRASVTNINGNPSQSNAKKWPIVDSYGQPFAWVQENSQDHWTVFKDDGSTVVGNTAVSPQPNTTWRVRLEVQGGGCMASSSNDGHYAIVALSSGVPRFRLPNNVASNGTYIGIRGFISLNALPDTFDQAHKSKADIGSHTNKCLHGSSVHYLPHDRTYNLDRDFPVSGDANRENDEYQGKDTWLTKCPRNPTDFPQGRQDRHCGAPYANYSAPDWAPNVRLLAVSTTATAPGGGVVTAVIRTGSFDRRDFFSYSDPNVPCGQKPVARWIFGDDNLASSGRRIMGWVPEHITLPAGTDPRTGGECP